MATMTTVRDVAAELMDEMGIDAARADDVADAVRSEIEGTYDDATARAAKADETGELAARREKLSRAVWSRLGLGAWPW